MLGEIGLVDGRQVDRLVVQQAREVRAVDVVAGFEVDDYVRWRLMEGLDDIGITLQHAEAIDAFERSRPGFLPVTTG